jgi:hypothetical protein
LPCVSWLNVLIGLSILSGLTAAAEPSLRATGRPAAVRRQEFPPARASTEGDHRRAVLTRDTRVAFIQKAQVWSPTDVSKMNMREGPAAPGAFHPNELVTCDFVERKMSGHSRKFYCAIQPDDIVKVRYGPVNGEVQGSVLATRLLWALGFAADRVYPVRVRCRGCATDPWNNRQRVNDVHEFDPAVIERPAAGVEMREGSKEAEWAWPELELVEAAHGGAPLEQLDALRLLAVFMQHTDTKPKQQRLLCLPGGLRMDGVCERPFLLLHDVGLTFGHANEFNRNKEASVNLEEWAATPVWRNAADCVGHLGKSNTGTLENPRIGEAGRRFLAALLEQLTDGQLRDLFEVAGVDRRALGSGAHAAPARIDDWIRTFKEKRNEIVANRCAS